MAHSPVNYDLRKTIFVLLLTETKLSLGSNHMDHTLVNYDLRKTIFVLLYTEIKLV